jgi:hypothetical protein
MRIKHNYLTLHGYSSVALPNFKINVKTNPDGSLEPWFLEQKDGSVIKVVPTGVLRFPVDNLPDELTKMLYGISAKHMQQLMYKSFPELMRVDERDKVVGYVCVKKL